ncbi:single-strand DNA-binding protein [Mucilaginibacter gracilis]|uniref:Single-stranded DNA-binding protein n=3 Tax=Mucilaginibacter TaxID=423349 RepID=H1YGZ3_9SPHI|nr:single-stranded DNA-binding protein [Mucilaginibacter gracilis]EHQ27402.1 single-strand binding protein [Mucilaginibacter paludis DSM 18603]RKR80966.1 single-strand DNA-binding protein [Mucilaginibacter gracilis]
MEITSTGVLTGKAEVREVKGGKTVTNFTIAVNRTYKKDGELKRETTFVDCAWWLNAGVAEYLTKGTVVELYGRIGARAWINRDGDAIANLTLTVLNLKLLGHAGKQGTQRADTEPVQTMTLVVDGKPGEDDDLPF